jgi:CTP synthase (UTP-ammonia lyase)
VLDRGSKVSEIYGATEISERHRHRYEVFARSPQLRPAAAPDFFRFRVNFW